MKAGTTTLYRDLEANPQVFFPRDKEPDNLMHSDVLSSRGRRQYAALYARASATQRCGDASTAYSKLPDVTGVPKRALALLGDQARIVYLVRQPVLRAISHHHHLVARRRCSPSFERALEQFPGIVDYGRYAMQLRPWLETFGHGALRVVVFEEYVGARQDTISNLSDFLRIPSRTEVVDDNVVHNRSESMAVVAGAGRALHRSQLYRRHVRPHLSATTQRRLRQLVSRPAPPRPPTPAPETVARLVDQFRPDSEELRVMLERDGPLWDWDAVLEAHHDAGRS